MIAGGKSPAAAIAAEYRRSRAAGRRARLRSFPRKREFRAKEWVPAFARTIGKNEHVSSSRSARVLSGDRLAPRRLDAVDGAGLVAIGGIAGNADRPDDVAGCASDQHAARIGHHASAAGRRQHREELRRLGRPRRERARAEAHAQRTPRFAEGDVEAQQAGFVLALERHEVTACVEHGDSERGAVRLSALLEGGVDDGRGLSKRYTRHIGSLSRQRVCWLKRFQSAASRGLPSRRRRRTPPPRPKRFVWFLRSKRVSSPSAAAPLRAPSPRPAWCANP